MKSSLFILVSRLNLLILKIIKGIGDSLIVLNGRLGWIILSCIDKKRLAHAEAASQQEEEISELSILFGMTEVRNDALNKGKWNNEHENTLNLLGNILANQHDWDVEEVERYLYEVIATGPEISKEE